MAASSCKAAPLASKFPLGGSMILLLALGGQAKFRLRRRDEMARRRPIQL